MSIRFESKRTICLFIYIDNKPHQTVGKSCKLPFGLTFCPILLYYFPLLAMTNLLPLLAKQQRKIFTKNHPFAYCEGDKSCFFSYSIVRVFIHFLRPFLSELNFDLRLFAALSYGLSVIFSTPAFDRSLDFYLASSSLLKYRSALLK